MHQFPVSPFCEKTRWHLEIKGLEYEVRNLFPGKHARINRQLVGQSSVPVLVDGARAIHNSSAISLYLEETYPGPQLLPADDGLRALVLALQSYFDNTVGPAVRHWVYGQLLRKRGRATQLFFHDYPRGVRWTGRLLSLFFERRLARMYPPNDRAVTGAEVTMLDGIERLENTIERDADRYLVGGALSLADIAAASLLGPVLGPPGSPWQETAALTPAVLAMRERLRARAGGIWVMRRYERDRWGTLPALPPRARLAAGLTPPAFTEDRPHAMPRPLEGAASETTASKPEVDSTSAGPPAPTR